MRFPLACDPVANFRQLPFEIDRVRFRIFPVVDFKATIAQQFSSALASFPPAEFHPSYRA